MKNTIQQLLLLGGILFLFSNCEKEFFTNNQNCNFVNGPTVSQAIDIANIHSIATSIPVELILSESDEQEIRIESSQSIIDALIANSSVNNEKWEVKVGCNNIFIDDGFPVIITASLSTIKEIELSGIGEARTEGVFGNITDLKLSSSGKGNFDFAVDSIQSLEVQMGGLGEYILSGFTDKLTIDISGSGEIKAFDLQTRDCRIDASGLGNCEVHVLENLAIRASGNVKICYKGKPTIDIDNSGNGEVSDCN